MVDFDKMAASAKLDSEKRQADEAARAKQESEKRKQQVAVGVDALERIIMPKLKEAQIAFARNGIEAKIIPGYDVQNFPYKLPSVSFHFLGPPRDGDGYRFESGAIQYSSDGNTIQVAATQGHAWATEKFQEMKLPIDRAALLVEKPIQSLLESYYKQLEGLPDIRRR